MVWLSSLMGQFALRRAGSNARHQRGRAEHSNYDEKLASRPPLDALVRPRLRRRIQLMLAIEQGDHNIRCIWLGSLFLYLVSAYSSAHTEVGGCRCSSILR